MDQTQPTVVPAQTEQDAAVPGQGASMPEGMAYVANFFNVNGFYPSLVQAFEAGAATRSEAQAAPEYARLEMNPDLLEILGRPNFQCIRIAQILRAGGAVIESRSENEQAAVLLFLLNHYLADNANWYTNASEELRAKFDKAKGGAA